MLSGAVRASGETDFAGGFGLAGGGGGMCLFTLILTFSGGGGGAGCSGLRITVGGGGGFGTFDFLLLFTVTGKASLPSTTTTLSTLRGFADLFCPWVNKPTPNKQITKSISFSFIWLFFCEMLFS